MCKDATLLSTLSDVGDVEWCGGFTIIKNTDKHAVVKRTNYIDEIRRTPDILQDFPETSLWTESKAWVRSMKIIKDPGVAPNIIFLP